MHSHDRTQIMRLGFNDPDKKLPLHDLACRYLSTSSAIIKMTSQFIKPCSGEARKTEWKEKETFEGSWNFVEEKGLDTREISNAKGNIEVPINKGTGEYKTTIGFCDVVVSVTKSTTQKNIKTRTKLSHEEMFPDPRTKEERHKCLREMKPLRAWSPPDPIPFKDRPWGEWKDVEDRICNRKNSYGVEVKINKVPLGDILRQIKLYRSYLDINGWALVTKYSLSGSEVICLAKEGIEHLVLGKDFDKYVEDCKNNDGLFDSPEI